MGDLKARLRAKFPRRTSGVSLLAPDKSSAPSTSSSETPGPRLSDAAGGGADVVNGRWKGGGSSGGDGASESSHCQALGAPPPVLTDRLRQKETSKQEISPVTQKPPADVRATSIDTVDDDTDADVDADKIQLHPSETPVAGAATPAHSDVTPQNAANAIQSGTMHSADILAGHAAAGSDGPDVNGNDQRVLMAKLSRINEDSSPDIATNNNNNNNRSTRPRPTADTVAAAADAAAVEVPSPTSSIPAEALRRIKLSDPPVNFPPSPTTATGDLSHHNSLNLRPSSSTHRPTAPTRRQSLLPSRQTTLIRTLLSAAQTDDLDIGADLLLPISANMVTRKIWVKRPGASATLVTINEEDLVDDVREMILRKYANSLGRHFDAPDLNLRITPREQRQERLLGPEEPMARTLDAYFPGGQTVEEALIIDIPPRRTPRASPRTGPPHAQHLTSAYFEETRPAEGGTDYFGPEAVPSPAVAIPGAGANGAVHPHAISVLSTGQVPQIPSPGGTRPRPYRDRPDRPRLGRQHTSSPTIISVVGAGGHPANIAIAANHGTQQPHSKFTRPRAHSNASSDQSASGPPPTAPPLPTPPVQQEASPVQIPRTATPPPRTASPRPPVPRPKKKKTIVDHPTLPSVMLNGGVPPINVLIVEDNIINLRLLEAFVKRLKVRWQTAMNGREAVTKWRAGGFHLVLMDIQLPVMSGLEATREIRRLERMNSIGAFSSSPPPPLGAASRKARVKGSGVGETANGATGELGEAATEEDKLENRELFKSPVIIVALTASSLQSDRHEALAAGCNDFLTKPVTYVWLERKVMEWGCMQALIDFDGWRKWKSYGEQKADAEAASAPVSRPRRVKS
ncbi:hypothetical protein B0T14DRAFT_533908 [Immersiella caudata]|uniref:Response regulatory domain-containing protein n=1 Tax=Immersiella caudata TaxID=314043 RepID=A0AA39XH09_9PEZI|nr:hypothetical protein B0T14DRAFT_533908 [Immersiella caudata]